MYEFYFWGGKNNSFIFETDLGIVYEVKFKPSDYLFSNLMLSSNFIYEFVIDVAINPTSKNPPLDIKVSVTVANIFQDFFFKNNSNVAIYICDVSDNKQDLRRRKFDSWFYTHQGEEFIKIDKSLVDNNHKIHPISLIIHRNNPKFTEIISAFKELGHKK